MILIKGKVKLKTDEKAKIVLFQSPSMLTYTLERRPINALVLKANLPIFNSETNARIIIANETDCKLTISILNAYEVEFKSTSILTENQKLSYGWTSFEIHDDFSEKIVEITTSFESGQNPTISTP